MSMRVVRTVACLTAVLALSSGSALTAAPPAASDKTIIVGVTDANGKPVSGLTAQHFRMREDGVDREITSVKPSDQPLSIVLLVDTTKAAIDLTQDMRTAVKSLVHYVHQAQPSADIQLMEFGQAAIPNTPFTKDDEVLDKAMDKMVGKPDASSVLTEAIIRASDELAKRPSPRRIILSFNLEPSEEQSMEQPKKILQSLQNSVAQLWAVSLQRGTLKNAKRDIVLESLTKNTGGTRQFIYDQAAIEGALKKAADGFLYQYEIHFNRPDGKRPTQVQIGTLAQGVTLHASGFAPE
jgi:Ca-activated chloride channel family protein